MKQYPDREFDILPAYLPLGTRRRGYALTAPGPNPLRARFLVAHDTGNPGSTAAGNVRYYRDTYLIKPPTSAHLFVDDHQILECVPALTAPPEKAWHVLYDRREDNILYGCNANDAAIGVEYCYGGAINADEAYRRYVWLLAYLCVHFQLDPRRDITGHCFLDPGRKFDPVAGLSHSRRTFPQLLADVTAIFQSIGGTLPGLPPLPSSVAAQGLVNIRQGEPFRRAPVARQVPAGAVLPVQGRVVGEAVSGNDDWYELSPGGLFCWSGAVR
ncbi:N-acetylmuramoyl-L-alanine amidase [Hymenobacter sp. BT523]|uniref:peptidoglycan recognition protein family protein n=1 Tax=Hymenobacter sp. BT523 TaxID=2795725 RepID=UPI0018EDF13B|nr:peptidoglycan recognition family protein [Hymenobacter sp. BT523]MBJ6107600.1 N-acetylmuramoyl-L-alanine amidase [Hymenobacter sp. BT523]